MIYDSKISVHVFLCYFHCIGRRGIVEQRFHLAWAVAALRLLWRWPPNTKSMQAQVMPEVLLAGQDMIGESILKAFSQPRCIPRIEGFECTMYMYI